MPVEDRFQIFHPVDPATLRFDRHYLTGPSSEDWMLLEITAGKTRSIEMNQEFYCDLNNRLTALSGLYPVDLMVVIRQNQAEDCLFLVTESLC